MEEDDGLNHRKPVPTLLSYGRAEHNIAHLYLLSWLWQLIHWSINFNVTTIQYNFV